MIIPSTGGIQLDASSFPRWKATFVIGIASGSFKKAIFIRCIAVHIAVYSLSRNVASDSQSTSTGFHIERDNNASTFDANNCERNL